jgi:WD40 repeat protein
VPHHGASAHQIPVFSPDNKRVAIRLSSGADKDRHSWVQVWDIATSQLSTATPKLPVSSFGLLFSPDGRWLVTNTWENGLTMWNASTGREDWSIKPLKQTLAQVTFDPFGKRLAAVVVSSQDIAAPAELQVWDMATRQLLYKVPLGTHWDKYSELAFSPDGKRLAANVNYYQYPHALLPLPLPLPHEFKAVVWDAATGKEQWRLKGHRFPIDGLVFTADNRRLITVASGGDKVHGEAKVWDMATGRPLLSLDLPVMVHHFVLGANGQRLVVSSGETGRTLSMWDVTPLVEAK